MFIFELYLSIEMILNNKRMLSFFAFLFVVVAAAILYYLRESNQTANENRDKNIDLGNKKTDLLLKIATMDDFDPRKKKLLEEANAMLNNDYELNDVLNNYSVELENEILDKALTYFIKHDYFKSLKVFEFIEFNTKDDYKLAICKSFIGRIYKDYIIDKDENPEKYFLEALSIFDKLDFKTEDFLVHKAEIYTDLGIYYKQKARVDDSKIQYESSM